MKRLAALLVVGAGLVFCVPSSAEGTGSVVMAKLLSVTCTRASRCTAVGDDATETTPYTIIEQWNGRTWSVVPGPSERGNIAARNLGAVACPRTSSCTAVGYEWRTFDSSSTLIQHWNGLKWSSVKSPNRRAPSQLNGVSCPSPSNCTAVGYFQNNSPLSSAPLIEHWNRSRWTIEEGPSVSGQLDGIDCVKPANCIAVGIYYKTLFGNATLVEHWNGRVGLSCRVRA